MNVRFFNGTKAEYLSLAKHNPIALYFCRDTRELFWGDRLISDGMRVVSTAADLPAFDEAADGIIYYVVETKNGYVLAPDRLEWIQVIYAPSTDNHVDLSDYYTKSEVDEAVAKIKLPDVSGFLTEVPKEYVTEAELSAKNYATEAYVLEKILDAQLGHNCDHGPAIDLSSYVTKDEIQDFIKEVPAEYVTEEELDKAIADVKVPEVSLEGLATEEFVLAKIAEAELNDKDVDLSAYYTKTEVDNLIPDVSHFVTKEEIPSVVGLATEAYVDEKFDSIEIPEVPENVSAFVNDAGYLTEHQSLEGYAKLSDIPSHAGLATEDFVKNAIAEAELNDKEVDLSGLATKDDIKDFASIAYVDKQIADIELPNIDGLASEDFVNKAIAAIEHPTQDLSEYAKKSDLFSKDYNELINTPDIPSIDGLATTAYVDNAIAEIQIPEVNFDGYATEDFVIGEIAKVSIPDVSDFATKVELADAIAAIEHPVQDLSEYVKKDEIADFIKEVPSEYITEEELNAKGYLTTHQDISHLATKEDIPDVSGFITEIPAEYVTDEELSSKGYLTEHQDLGEYAKKSELFSKDYNDLINVPEIPSVAGLASVAYVDDKFDNIPETDLSGYATEELVAEVSAAKADNVPFNTPKFVTKAIGGFIVGEDISGLTIADLFAKLLELSDESTDPDEPVTPDDPNNPLETAKKLAMYSVTTDNELVATSDTSITTLTVAEAAEAPTKSGFYQIIDDNGEVIESGYQDLTITSEDTYYIIALPKVIDYNTMVKLQAYDADDAKWYDADKLPLISDPDTVAALCDEVGVDISHIDTDVYTVWVLEDICTGSQLRYIIKEA